MKKTVVGLGALTVVILMVVFVYHVSAVSGSSWSKTFGNSDNEGAYSIIRTQDGGYVLAGFVGYGTEGYYYLANRDAKVVKVDSSGNEEWSKSYGGVYWDEAYSVVQTNDGGYALTGRSLIKVGEGITNESLDFWLVKLNSSGDNEWSKTYGKTGSMPYWGVIQISDEAHAVIQTENGEYVLAGWTSSPPSGYGEYHEDFWLVKVDSLGNEVWNKTYGGTGDEKAYSAIKTEDGGYMLVGTVDEDNFWLVKVDSSGNENWSKSCSGKIAYSVLQTVDGGYLVVGKDTFDDWVVKLDSSGNEEWSKSYGGSAAYSAIQTSDGGYVVVGYTWSDLWLVKIDNSGNLEWSKTYGGGGNAKAYSVIQMPDGGYAIGGYTESYGAGGSDFWLLKTDSSGNVEGLNPEGRETTSPGFPIWLIAAVLVGCVIVVGLVLFLKRRGGSSGGDWQTEEKRSDDTGIPAIHMWRVKKFCY